MHTIKQLGGRGRGCTTPVRGALLMTLAAVAAAGSAVGVAGVASAAGAAGPAARAAHVADVKDEGHLHSVRSAGAELVEEGQVGGTIPGKVRVSFIIGATVSAKFTIYANGGGSISGHGGGSLHSTNLYSTFGGSLTVTGGSGRYAHAHGSGRLSGSINRKSSSYPMTVQAQGTLYY